MAQLFMNDTLSTWLAGDLPPKKEEEEEEDPIETKTDLHNQLELP